jgi:hypothetical protein
MQSTGHRPAHERLRRLAQLKLPEIDRLIERATAVRALLETCSRCDCESLDVCSMLDERASDGVGTGLPARLTAV